MSTPLERHAVKRAVLAARLREGGGTARLAKDTSNLFRDRTGAPQRHLDVRAFTEVLRIDPAAGVVEAEGMIPYEALVDECLAHGVMPAVVPQLKTITLGGAVAGVGIEASSHRYGLVHDTVEALDVLTSDGRVLHCTRDNEHADLFYGFPNSYGTFGYALSVRARVVPVQPFVRLQHRPFTDRDAFFAELETRVRGNDADFIDATVFGPREMVLTLACFAEHAPTTSDYTYEHIYYRSLREKREDWLSVRDFIWRWDTDWFWCSKNVLAQNPVVRRLYGRERLGSRTYTKIMRWNSRLGLTRRIERLMGLHSESVIQDVDVPLASAGEFFDFYAREVGIWPQWICPIGPQPDSGRFVLYPIRAERYLNFGFWDVKRTREPHPRGHFNRMIEEKVVALGGIKSLYSDSFFTEDEFARLYGGEAYARLKTKYDPGAAFPGVYEKCVLRR